MELALVGQAVVVFAVTNVDDALVVTALLGQAAGRRRAVLAVIAGRYLGTAVVLGLSLAGAYAATSLPARVLGYLGLVPLALGLVAARRVWRRRRALAGSDRADGTVGEGALEHPPAPGVGQVTAVTVASGGDNVGVYVPLFVALGPRGTAVHVLVFLVGVAAWCAAGVWLTARPAVARALARWGDVLLAVVLVGLGLALLVDGGVLGP